MTAYVSKPGEDALTTGAASSVYSLDMSRLQQLRALTASRSRLLVEPGATVAAARRRGLGHASTGCAGTPALDVRYDPSKLWVLGSRARRARRR